MSNAGLVCSDSLLTEVVAGKRCCRARTVQPRCAWICTRDARSMAARRRPGRPLQTVACQSESAADSGSATAQPLATVDGDELWARLSLMNR